MNVAPLYKTFWRRFWAGYVDAFVLTPLTAVDWWVHWTSPGARAAWFVCSSALFIAYPIYMHGRFGQTVGKRLLRVKVVDLSGSPLTMAQSLRREAINLPFALWSLVAGIVLILRGGHPYDAEAPVEFGAAAQLSLALFLIEIISTLGSPKRRAVHDLIAGSVVIRVGALGVPEPINVALEDSVAAPARPPTVDEFACTACGHPVRLGASHCRACDQTFTYRDGKPIASA